MENLKCPKMVESLVQLHTLFYGLTVSSVYFFSCLIKYVGVSICSQATLKDPSLHTVCTFESSLHVDGRKYQYKKLRAFSQLFMDITDSQHYIFFFFFYGYRIHFTGSIAYSPLYTFIPHLTGTFQPYIGSLIIK